MSSFSCDFACTCVYFVGEGEVAGVMFMCILYLSHNLQFSSLEFLYEKLHA